MSLVQTLQQVTALHHDVSDQVRLINDFKKANKDNINLVLTELKGSTKGYDQVMVASLNRAESALDKSLAALDQAANALQRVRAI